MGIIAKRPLANVAWAYGTRPAEAYYQAYWSRLRALDYGFLRNPPATAVGTAPPLHPRRARRPHRHRGHGEARPVGRERRPPRGGPAPRRRVPAHPEAVARGGPIHLGRPGVTGDGAASMRVPHVVIVGGGFGGLAAAKALAQGARPRHGPRPPQPPPLPAAALPGRHRRPLARGDRLADPRGSSAISGTRPSSSPRRRRSNRRPRRVRLADGDDRLRPPDRRHRRHPFLLRPPRLGVHAPGLKSLDGRARDPAPRAPRLREGRARDRGGRAPPLAHLRGRRRRARPVSRWRARSPRSPATPCPASSATSIRGRRGWSWSRRARASSRPTRPISPPGPPGSSRRSASMSGRASPSRT